MPATGQPIDVMSISLITVRDGRIVHYDVLADRLGLLGQVRAGGELKRGRASALGGERGVALRVDAWPVTLR